MTTGSQPNNATPHPLHLPPRNIPRMPFSSPMGEEVLSPTSLNSSSSPPQPPTGTQQRQDTHKTHETYGRAHELLTLSKDELDNKKEKRQTKSRWPSLNLVTDFRKPLSPPRQVNKESTQQDRGLGLRRRQDSMAAEKIVSPNTSLQGQQQIGHISKPSASKGRLGDLKRAESKTSTLSPSDRAVIIGISVSPEELAGRSTSPQTPGMKNESLSEQSAQERHPSATPKIIVTPANEIAPWSALSDEHGHDRLRTASSSVYSQIPKDSSRAIDSIMVPPIPPLPPDLQRHQPIHNWPNAKGSRSRVLSSHTLFDEDESPTLRIPERPISGESQLQILKRSSTDSVATSHRSQGWWDQLISPFFPRSPMTFKFTSPPLSRPGSSLQNHQAELPKHRRSSSSTRPKSEDLKSGHTSWTDSVMEIESEKDGPIFDNCRRSTLVLDRPPEAVVSYPHVFPGKLESFGEAAEYFEACLHDMHSATPYFECQNHMCFPPTRDPIRDLRQKKASSVRATNDDGALNNVPKPVTTGQPQILAVQQAPTNRFSAAFHEATGSAPKTRPESEATVIEDLDTTPDVQEAHVAPILRAPEPIPATQPPIPKTESQSNSDAEEIQPETQAAPREPPAYSPPKERKPPKRFVAVMPPIFPSHEYEHPISPAPPTPGPQVQAPRGAIPLSYVASDSNEARALPNTNVVNNYHQNNPVQALTEPTTLADLYPPPRTKPKPKKSYESKEKKELPAREQKPKRFPKCRNCTSRDKPMEKKKKRMLIVLAFGLVLLIVCILILAMTLTRKGNKMPVQSQWLNITGYPPIPTGISTIIQANAVKETTGCIAPATLWSCALPKELQQSVVPNAPDQPNFRVEIAFQNGTTASTPNSSNINNKRFYGRYANAVSAGSFVRRRLLKIRDSFYTPTPLPPSQEDQTFLGNFTDGNLAPFDGEYTPFFMSFQSSEKLPSSRVRRRQSSSADDTSDPFPDVATSIPPPDNNPDGTVAPANLLAYPSAQPLRLYDRGQPTEHYGFYNYFDRSIFLKDSTLLNSSSDDTGLVPDDENGGANEREAFVRCTWAQTRFLVQIWTKKPDALLSAAANQTSKPSAHVSQNATKLTSSSANDFARPGSFPYPVSITLDRHGGDIKSKMVYCYGMDDRERIVSSEKKLQLEDRAFGGQLVNPALGPFGDVNVTMRQGGPGGIDGGSGGCTCKWQNWA